MSNLLKSLYDILTLSTREPVEEKNEKYMIIKAVNDCDEERFIQVRKPIENEQLENLRILYKKSKRLISSLSRSSADDETFHMVLDFHEKVKRAKYKDEEEVDDLFDEYEELKKYIRRMSISNLNLSSLEISK